MSKFTPFNLFIRQALLYPLTSPFLPPVSKVQKDYSYANGTLLGTLEAAVQKNYPADQLFTDNGDGTISDASTGLMWAKDGNGAGCNNGARLTWQAAIDYCDGLTFAAHEDWRLPTVSELATILDYSLFDPSINPLFINTQIDSYWTATTEVFDPINSWIIYFGEGHISNSGVDNEYFIRAVRKY